MNAPLRSIAELHREYLRKTSPWNDERDALLAELLECGHSLGRCAEIIGGGITRNSAIGRAYRLGLKASKKPAHDVAPLPPRQARPARPKPPARPVAARIVILKAKGEPKMSVKLAINEPIVDRYGTFECEGDTSIPIMDLVDGVCHWPYDVQDEPVRYCGVKAIEGASWCGKHAGRVWQPARERA